MKPLFASFSFLASVAVLLCGCGQSKPAGSGPTAENPPAAQAEATKPATASPAAAAEPARPPANPPQAAASPETAGAAPAAAASAAPGAPAPAPAADAAAQLVTTAKAQGDTTLASIGSQLADKTKALTQSAGANDTVNTQVDSSMKSLAAGNDVSGLTGLFQAAKGVNLTPQQTQLAKDVGNLASAYVVQKNFSNLPGAQSDVATIVSSLRQGELTPALPALKKVAQNANLTSQQKQLVSSLADHYAPGLTKASGTLQQGLKSLENLGGSGN
jgi:hypothetical protein